MKQILIATHGKMASGIRYTLELVAGRMDNVTTMDAYVTPDDNVEEQFQQYFESHREDRIYAFTDLQGGSVNQKLIPYTEWPNVTLITGINFPVLLQVALAGEEISEEELQMYIAGARDELKLVSLKKRETKEPEPAAQNQPEAKQPAAQHQSEAKQPAQKQSKPESAASCSCPNSAATVSALRVDDRLIHGQVAMTWTRQLRVQGIMVANDDAAADPTQKMALQMAVPNGIKVLIKPVDEIIRMLNYPKASDMRILVLTRTVRDALKIQEHVGKIEFLNIGNVGRFDGIDASEKEVVTPTIMLTKDEKQCLEKLVELEPDTCIQQVPNDEKRLVRNVMTRRETL
ncbi:MAG: PTS sugar transporter subunit IIB [Eubacteriales bacterium]|nr:PTS sugar transporter subunit IIB [Eubacteriales bacterium]